MTGSPGGPRRAKSLAVLAGAGAVVLSLSLVGCVEEGSVPIRAQTNTVTQPESPEGAGLRDSYLAQLKADPSDMGASLWVLNHLDNEIYSANAKTGERRTAAFKSALEFAMAAKAAMEKDDEVQQRPGSGVESVKMLIAQAALGAGEDKLAFDTASELLADNVPGASWNSGNITHDMNMVLGELAFRDGNFKEADKRLEMAGQTEGSKQLTLSGPEFPLAVKLLDRGDREAVLRYLDGVAKFWDPDQVRKWQVEIREGKTPRDTAWFIRTRGS